VKYENYRLIVNLDKVVLGYNLELQFRVAYLDYLYNLTVLHKNSHNPVDIDFGRYVRFVKYIGYGQVESDDEQNLWWVGFEFPKRLKENLDLIEYGIPGETKPMPIINNFLSHFSKLMEEAIVWDRDL